MRRNLGYDYGVGVPYVGLLRLPGRRTEHVSEVQRMLEMPPADHAPEALVRVFTETTPCNHMNIRNR